MTVSARERKSTVIHQIVTHRNPDIDDAVAIYLLREYGEKHHPRIKNADIITTNERRPLGKTPEELEFDGILLVGIGGSRYDEHPFGGVVRSGTECAATLVAKYLGINDEMMLKPVIKYALDKNYSAVTTPFDFSLLLKLAFRYLCNTGDKNADRRTVENIFYASFMFFDAVGNDEFWSLKKDRAPRTSTVRSMDEYVARWLIQTFNPKKIEQLQELVLEATAKDRALSRIVAKHLGKSDDVTLRNILDYASKYRTNESNPEGSRFDLAPLVATVQKESFANADRESLRLKVLEIAVNMFLTATWKKECNFHVDCQRDYDSSNTRQVASFGRAPDNIRIVSVASDNPEIAKFCRSKKGGYSAVVIKREPKTGNMQIFFDQKRKIDLKPIIRDLRIAERLANGMHGVLSWHREILCPERPSGTSTASRS
jgi:hypothetical protein